MGLFKSATPPDPELLRLSIQPDDKDAVKAIGKSSSEIRDRAQRCGGDLQAIAYSFFDKILVITTLGFFEPLTKRVVKLSDLRSVAVSDVQGIWCVSIDSRTDPRITYRVKRPGEAYRIQELLGFN